MEDHYLIEKNNMEIKELTSFVNLFGPIIIEPSIKYQTIMQKYCNYFKKLFRNEVLVFVYERCTEQDGFIGISNTPRLFEIYLETEAYKNTHAVIKAINKAKTLPFDFIRLDLQATVPIYKQFRIKIQEELDLYTTFLIIEKCLNYTQIFSWIFRTPKAISLQEEQHYILQDYMNNLTITNFIIKHFKEQYCHLITQEFDFVKTPEIESKEIEAIFLKKEKLLKHENLVAELVQDEILTKDDLYLNDIRLSYQEIHCLHYYLQNMTSKEIANKMDLSHRTVENYINNIKSKFGVYNKSELYEKAKKLQLWQRGIC